MKEPKEWYITYYDEYAKIIETDMLDMNEPDVLIEVFLRLESNPKFAKVIVRFLSEKENIAMPFAVINKVVS